MARQRAVVEEKLERRYESSPGLLRLRIDLSSAPSLATRIPTIHPSMILLFTTALMATRAEALTQILTVRVSRRLREDLEELARLEGKSEAEVIREVLEEGIRERKIRRALKLYSEGKVTLWKAARLAGVSLWEMIDALKRYDVKLQYGPEELEEDLRAALSEEGSG
ncbi:MAG: hypothetical protein DRK00_06230 [Thermoprotei archaeon]|nr:MAG: hypothetical protein DRK00_06230 [Thermoprotei archaeon]